MRLKEGETPVVSFENFVMEDGSPIYGQILRFIKQGIAAGVMGDGDEMPSRRVLSALLGVNPATVQKAYHFLEEEGIVTSRTGVKSYISADAERTEAIRRQLFEGEALSAVAAMKRMGMSREEALLLVERLWKEEEQ